MTLGLLGLVVAVVSESAIVVVTVFEWVMSCTLGRESTMLTDSELYTCVVVDHKFVASGVD